MKIGIPYASRHVDDDGQWYCVCPECGQRIDLNQRKDFESLSGREYAEHYEDHHAPLPPLREVADHHEAVIPLESDESAVCDYCPDEPEARHRVSVRWGLSVFVCACCLELVQAAGARSAA